MCLSLLQVGADHLDVKIDTVVDAMARLLSAIVGRTPRFRVLHVLMFSALDAAAEICTVPRLQHYTEHLMCACLQKPC